MVINYEHWNLEICYHTEHFSIGFIGLPLAHLKSFAKSLLLDNGPLMRNSPGEC